PNHLKALFNLGRLYIQQGEPRKAFDAFARIIELNGDNTTVWNYLGYIYETLGSVDYAIFAYSNSLIINNYQEDAHYNLARLQYLQYRSNPDPAMLDGIKVRLQYVLSVDSKHREAKQLLGMIQLHRSREQRAAAN
ncbi:MAG: tetratricopeptide repeat protein, partial [Syntrophorhabdaceae bacterium]|nr:tetratricopeptide repeat protein [Syntrophorhabdaceae bacterium]